MGELMDAPNQQAVRPDGSAPWEEGDGGSSQTETQPVGLDAMTKAQLLEYAAERDIDADESMTKAQIREAIDEAGA